MLKNVNILECGHDIQIHREKCIEIMTNMPSIGLEIAEIAFEISDIRNKKDEQFLHGKTNSHVLY